MMAPWKKDDANRRNGDDQYSNNALATARPVTQKRPGASPAGRGGIPSRQYSATSKALTAAVCMRMPVATCA
jgi:hypothetical protein